LFILIGKIIYMSTSNAHTSTNAAIQEYFAGKPHTHEIFTVLQKEITAHGESTMTVASQISFSAKRKFAWIWLYNVTGANPEGTVQIMLALGREVAGPPVYRVTQLGKNRWNHLVVVHSLEEARDPKLRALIKEAYAYGVE
jgi:hypothetical protein